MKKKHKRRNVEDNWYVFLNKTKYYKPITK